MSMAEYLHDKGLYEDYLEWRKLTPQERELEKMRYTNPTRYKSEKLYLQRQKEGRYDLMISGMTNERECNYYRESIEATRQAMIEARHERNIKIID